MEVLGLAIQTILLFVAFGGMVGVIFGFFGMGSFLLTPTLLVMGYDSKVAVGSGLAFVFGTAVIGTIRHRDLGQVSYRVGLVLILGTVLGIEIGKQGVLYLDRLGLSAVIVGSTYVILLAAVGLFILFEAATVTAPQQTGSSFTTGSRLRRARDALIALRSWLWQLSPRVRTGDTQAVSILVVFGLASVTGVLSGFLGVGGGFLRLPALTYLFGMGLPMAVGTNIFTVMVTGAFGSYTWAIVGGVDLHIVAPLLVGSALGARIGSATTRLVAEDEMKRYLGALLLVAAVAVGLRQLGDALSLPLLRHVSLFLLLGAATLVSGGVVFRGIVALRRNSTGRPASAD